MVLDLLSKIFPCLDRDFFVFIFFKFRPMFSLKFILDKLGAFGGLSLLISALSILLRKPLREEGFWVFFKFLRLSLSEVFLWRLFSLFLPILDLSLLFEWFMLLKLLSLFPLPGLAFFTLFLALVGRDFLFFFPFILFLVISLSAPLESDFFNPNCFEILGTTKLLFKSAKIK